MPDDLGLSNGLPMADNKHSPAVVEIDARAVGLVSPLPQQVRQRWDSWQADGNSVVVRREVSLDEIQSRLQAAEAKRAVRSLRALRSCRAIPTGQPICNQVVKSFVRKEEPVAG